MRSSTRKRRETEQKRPSHGYELEYAPIPLDDEFAIKGGGVFHQSDGPITSLHVHDSLEIGYCRSGSGIFVVEDKIMQYGTDDVSVINDRELHLARSAQGTTSEWYFIDIDPARLVRSAADEQQILDASTFCGPGFANVLTSRDEPEVVQTVRALVSELAARRDGFRSAVRGIVWTMMAQLHRLPGRSKAAGPKRSQMSRVAPALEHMARHYDEELRIEDIAELSHLSVTHFRRLFNQATDCGPLEYLTRLRIRMAGALLRSTDRPVIEIAMNVGYRTLSSFNRHFKTIMKTTPREWRKTPSALIGGREAVPRSRGSSPS